MAQILVIDDDKSILKSFKSLFEGKHTILGAYNGKEAINLLKNNRIDLVYLDYRMPGEDGLEVLKRIKAIDPDTYVVIITGYGSVETTIRSMSLGAYDYIEKPLDIDKIRILTTRALESRRMESYVKIMKNEQIENYSLKRLIGKSQRMQDIFKQIGRLVDNDVNVLITGESGTGKELIAKALHYNSKRKNDPFMAVNCSGLSDTLLDNELFGHEAQAFTGAQSRKSGKFEAAGEGTVFLDEIGDMSSSIQSKLLRVIEQREFHRLGGTKTIKLRARIISATNRNLIEEVKNGSFRKDLFYRINVATIIVPPLRERKEDIPLLVDYFIKNANYQLKKNIKGISKNSLAVLKENDWPGNVRELENIITNICIYNQDSFINSIDTNRLDKGINISSDIFDDFIDNFLKDYEEEDNLLPLMLDKLENKLFEKLGKKLSYNKTAMSKALGLSRVTLQKKLKKKGM